MKMLCVCLAGLALAAVLGCSKDSTSPLVDDTYVLEETQTIGGVGGTVETDDFSLFIPAGAFAEDHTVTLYVSSEDRPFEENQVTRTFRLEGLPEEYSQPLRVSIKYDGVLSGETYLAQGSRVFDYLAGDTAVVHSLRAASDSAGYLVAQIPQVHQGVSRLRHGIHMHRGAADGAADPLELLGLNGYSTRETEHFAIRYPLHLVEVNMGHVAELLEGCYQTVVDDIHLSYEARWWQWPIGVVVKRLPSDAPRSVSCARFPDRVSLSIDQATLSRGDLATVRVDAGQELLALALESYDRFDPADVPRFWLALATLVWAQEWCVDGPGYQYPDSFVGREMAPFHGMRAGAGQDWQSVRLHGFGMSALIEYLVNDPRYGEYGIRNTFEAIWGGTAPTAALLNNVNALVSEWWPQFFKAYVGGELYGVGKGVFTSSSNLSGSWTIATGDDSVKVFTGRYPDLSAKLYLINLDYPTIDESADLLLALGGQTGYQEPWGVMAFGVGATSLEYWGHSIAQGSTSLQVPGLKALYDAGTRQILVVAICSNPSDTYLQETDADLEIRITQEEEPIGGEWNAGHLYLWSIRGQYARDYFDPGEEDTEYEYADRNFESVYFQGSTTGNTFTASWDNTVLSYRYQGSVLAVFSGDPPSEISEIEWNETISTDTVTRSYSITMNGVPVSSNWDNGFTAEVWGGETCDYLGSLFHTITYATFRDVLQEWECNTEYPQSGIRLSFSKE
ncbi:hypothetical protein JXA88_06220 [Candidatus Fermentibacteria bacterium]|nr:hypothetical protein [Candidatus Fermentibacteria bacterium]